MHDIARRARVSCDRWASSSGSCHSCVPGLTISGRIGSQRMETGLHVMDRWDRINRWLTGLISMIGVCAVTSGSLPKFPPPLHTQLIHFHVKCRSRTVGHRQTEIGAVFSTPAFRRATITITVTLWSLLSVAVSQGSCEI